MTDFALSPQVFAILSALIEERTGIHYGPGDSQLVADKLAPRVLERGLDSLLDYYYFLRYDPRAEAELAQLVEALVVRETYFFRELPALEVLTRTIVPELLAQGRKPRIWCAAGSTGEEPLTLAMLLDERGLLDDTTIVASDISARALAHAKEGRYFRRSLRSLTPEAEHRWFVPCEGGVRVLPRIQNAVEWHTVNLISPGDVARLGPFDVILCRNVLIYFSDATVGTVISLLAGALHPEGLLMVGASESLLRFDVGFACEEREGSFFYRKGRS